MVAGSGEQRIFHSSRVGHGATRIHLVKGLENKCTLSFGQVDLLRLRVRLTLSILSILMLNKYLFFYATETCDNKC